MKASKSRITRDIFWRSNEKLFAHAIEKLRITGEDIGGGKGVYLYFFESLDVHTSNCLWFLDRPCLCIMDCMLHMGSEKLMRQILALDNDIKDEPGPDKTTAF
jgi:hypothetical protein